MAELRTIGNAKRGAHAARQVVLWVLLCVLLGFVAAPALAWMDIESPLAGLEYNPNGVFILDGSFVMNVGEVQINITNWGLIGSTYSSVQTWSNAPSCQWPAGSGNEYLWSSGLWVGGVLLGERLVSSGGISREVLPRPDDVEATIYEAIGGHILRPSGNPNGRGSREPQPGPDDDLDGLIDEEILNGIDDDGDGLIDEDFGQIGNQMFVLTNYDNTALAQEINPDHTPMNLEIVQTSFQWENDQVDDFVGFDYTIKNIGVTDIERVYIGFFSDSDIGARGASGTAEDDMAGSWPLAPNHGSPGMVRASDGSFVALQIGYMYDASELTPLDGYFGIVFLGHDVDPSGRLAPEHVGMRTFQSFVGNASFEQGGDPTNDDERYQLLSAPVEEWDNDTPGGKQGDFRFLVSAGPFEVMPSGESLSFQVGMVMGAGLSGLLANAAEAVLTWDGIWTDEIPPVMSEGGGEFNPGVEGRETLLCREDFASGATENPWDSFKPDYMDQSCLDPEWVLGQVGITADDKFAYVDPVTSEAKTCAMFNMDNCFECARQLGHVCEQVDFEQGSWTCDQPGLVNNAGCTGVDGLDHQIHWLVGMAPPPPGLRLWSTDSNVHVFWDDRSMITPDIRLQTIDFESYRVWRADNWSRPFGSSLTNGPESGLWQMVSEFDLVNSYIVRRVVDSATYLDTIPLGANTGMDAILYDPAVLADPRFEGLSDSMQVVVDLDPQNQRHTRPPVRDLDGAPNQFFPIIGRWETYTDELDTFWNVAARIADATVDPPVIGKRPTQYFEYQDSDIHNGFIYFYSVTATDHVLPTADDPDGLTLPLGPGLVGDPGSSFDHTVPGTVSQTAAERKKFGVNIYVYPNPATRVALAEYQQLSPDADDPTGIRVSFTNLPAAHNTIKIYTVGGDLVQTIPHDGLSGIGHVSWNLMSRNGQEIVSGVYLYTVQSDDSSFEDYVGKFVVVR